METVYKICAGCEQEKPISEYYKRSGMPHLRLSECKDCMKARSVASEKTRSSSKRELIYTAGVPHYPSSVPHENDFLEYVKQFGILALPGSALSYAHVDAVLFGVVRVEIKYSPEYTNATGANFKWTFTPIQKKHGVKAEIIVLICGHADKPQTFHWFEYDNAAFYKNGTLKTSVSYTPGLEKAKPAHYLQQIAITDSMMQQAQDRIALAFTVLHEQMEAAKNES
jgi:hypothetical protein